MIFALPLMIAPVMFLTWFGFENVEPVASRLVAAALIGIGGVSFLVRDKGLEVFQALLSLKILWSLSAIAGICISLYQGAPKVAWVFLAIFAVFSGVWICYKIQFNKV